MRGSVIISGLGPVSALGIGVGAFWEGLVAGACGIRRIASFDASGFGCPFAAQAPQVDLKDWVPRSYRKATKLMVRDTELAIVAAKLAADDADLRTRASDDTDPRPLVSGDDLGCMIGAGLIPSDVAEMGRALVSSLGPDGRFSTRRWGTLTDPDEVAAHERAAARAWGPLSSIGPGGGHLGGPAPDFEAGPIEERIGAGGMNNLPPLWMLKYLPNMLACHVTIVHGALGPSNTHTVAEASGMLAINEAVRVIERGDARACFAGGAESKLNFMGLLRWDLAGRLARLDPSSVDGLDPASILRPYDSSSLGGVLGEAGALVIVEEEQHAIARGQTRGYARVLGIGAGHWPRPVRHERVADAEGPDRGLVTAIRAAIRRAGVTPGAIDAIVPTAIGVPSLDRAEALAFREVFGDRVGEVALVPITPAVGNCVAGLSGLQVSAGALMLHHQRLCARAHAGVYSPIKGINSGAAASEARSLRHVLVCTSGFGGQSAALILGAM